MKEDEASRQQEVKGQVLCFADAPGGPIKLFWLLLLTFLAVHLCNPLIFPDFFWDLSVGNWILEQGRLPLRNVFTAAGAQQPWLSLSWGFSLILSLLEFLSGELGLIIFKFLLFLLNMFALDFLLREVQKISSGVEKVPSFARGLLVVLVSVGLLFESPLSASLFALLSFQLFVALFLRMRRITWSRFSWFLFFLLAVLFSNISYGVLLAVPVVALLSLFLSDRRKSSLLYSALLALSTLATPYFIEASSVAFRKAYFFLFHRVFELRSLLELASYPLGIAILLLVFSEILCLQNKSHPLSLWLFRVLTLLAVPCAAFTPLALLIGAAVLASLFAQPSYSAGEAREGIERLRAMLVKLPFVGITFVIFAAAFAGGVHLLRMPSVGFHLPHRALDAVLDVDTRFEIYHPKSFGGFFVYRLSELPGRLALHAPATEYLDVEVSEDLSSYSSVILSGADSRVEDLESSADWTEVGLDDARGKLRKQLSWRAFVRR